MRFAFVALLLLCGCPFGVNEHQMKTCREACAPRGVHESSYERCICETAK